LKEPRYPEMDKSSYKLWTEGSERSEGWNG